MYFTCGICGNYADDGDTYDCICLQCIDKFSTELLSFYKASKCAKYLSNSTYSLFKYYLDKELSEKGLKLKKQIKQQGN